MTRSWMSVVPFAFVLLWSTGFIGARYGLPYIEPFNYLFIRMLFTLAVFFVLMQIFRGRWPSWDVAKHQLVTGSLIHAGYLGGVFAAIKLDMPAGVTAIIVGLQPLLTAFISQIWLKSKLSPMGWVGLWLGLIGVVTVLWSGVADEEITLTAGAIIAALVALFSISLGTLYQKRFGGGADLLTGSFIQYVMTAIIMGALTFAFETQEVVWHIELIGAMTWLVLGLSLSAILLLMLMIREGESAKVASYFYLVPPATALEAWYLFDERLSMLTLVGVAVTVLGVFLTQRAAKVS